ncbi:MAG: hypothetical protein JWO06_2567 [Bacteroidota bacterium]|nr:hypothetical protein [Bacteroidota bacterium]
MKKFTLALLFLVAFIPAWCSHIVGGELSYTCSGGNQYHITLKLYRDCNCTNCAAYGNPEYLAIFDASGNLVAQPPMPFPGSNTLNPTVSSPCLIPPSVCVEQAIYTADVTLPASTGGYTIVYQRCCRNNGVVNMVTGQGATYTIEIPDPGLATCNSSPHFNSLPPLFICVNAPVSIDYSATDPDADSLVYSLCDPYDGANSACPDPSPNNTQGGCPSAPPAPPYAAALYNAPYTATNFTNNPSNTANFTINSHTGLLTGTPNTIGIFDVTVCVSEYRNGQLLGVLRRDFQFTVAQCNTPIAAIPQIGTNNGTGVYIVNCHSLTVDFINNSYNPPPNNNPIYYSWDFGVTGTNADTSDLVSPSFTYPDSGVYTVRLIANKDEGNGVFCADTTYSLVYVYPNFTTNFVTTNICQGTVAQFTDLTQSTYGHITGWNWTFGDGSASNQQNPSHVYANPGTYTVTLINGNILGCADTAQRSITIFPKPNGSFLANSFCMGSPTNFSDTASNITGYAWNFGDGSSSTLQSPSHTYASAGNYLVTLVVQNAQGCRDTVSRLITIDVLPNAHFNFTPPCAGSAATFIDTSAGISSYTWNFGDGSATSNLANPSHIYVNPGTYNVTLVVVTAHGCKDSVVEALNTLPSPVITISNDTTICRYGSAQLNASGGVTYSWRPIISLNNPNIPNPIASPAATTTYVVTVTNDFNCSSKDSVKVTVFTLSNAPFTSDTPCVNTTVTFGDTATNISGYNWNFGDGSSNSTLPHPSHVYSASGNYLVTLIVQSIQGCFDTLQQSITVYPLPDASFTVTPGCVNLATAFTSAAANISSYDWNFGDGSQTSTQQSPSHIYTSLAAYTVSLTVISNHGCKDSSTQSVSPLPLPTPAISNDTVVCPMSDVQLVAGGGVSYLWVPATGLSDSSIANPVAFISNAITYTVYVTNQFNCTGADSMKITLLPLIAVDAGPDFDIDKGQSVQINAVTTGSNIVWTPATGLSNPNILNPMASPDSTTAYILTVTGPNGCLASDTMIVDILKDGYAFPTAFSPNGDGKNDLFYPVLMADVKVVTFRIYNRWGEVIYDNPTHGWDGKFNSKDQPPTTYVYYAILRIPNSLLPSGSRDIKHEGSFTLLR